MRPRFLPSPISVRFQRLLHSTAVREGARNHYEVLQIPTNATPAEVKKSFYALSKTHHPDHNPEDPNASERFVEISEAYHVLGIPAKRQAYDREHIHVHQHAQHTTPRGSYSSTQTPAGGRPASGLSRRRTQFRGPPPSFYRSGGWGHHSAKRKAAQDNGAPGAEQPSFDENLGGTAGGMGYGQNPFRDEEFSDLPHFDRHGHLRTHENQDKRRRRRRTPTGEYIPTELPRGTLENFLFVGGIIAVGVLVPTFLIERAIRRNKKEK